MKKQLNARKLISKNKKISDTFHEKNHIIVVERKDQKDQRK